nr:DNA cytosine methyltransferase [Spirulina subsalsa]
MLKCVDLFSGCGGFSLGFQQAGFEVCQAFDHWDSAVNVYRKNFKHPSFLMDLRQEKEASAIISEIQPDLIMGGPPCQDFSSAGKRNPALGRASLTYSFANIVCEVKPHWFVMENVPQIKKAKILKQVIDKFIETGYGISSVILEASYCGVPQARTRFFLIGHLDDKHNQLNDLFKQNLSDKPMTIRDYLGDRLGIAFYYRHPRNYNRRGIFSIDEPSPTIRGVNRPLPKGYKLNSCDPQNIDLSQIRPLTTQERSYLQTFPASFSWEGTKTDLEQMIGNAVPVQLAKFVGQIIGQYLAQGSGKIPTLFELEEEFNLAQMALHRL